MTSDSMLPDEWKGPENLRAYYARCVAGSPAYPHWAHGVEVCDRWLELQERADLGQTDIDQLLARLESEIKRGSMWPHLTSQFRAWAKERGCA